MESSISEVEIQKPEPGFVERRGLKPSIRKVTPQVITGIKDKRPDVVDLYNSRKPGEEVFFFGLSY